MQLVVQLHDLPVTVKEPTPDYPLHPRGCQTRCGAFLGYRFTAVTPVVGLAVRRGRGSACRQSRHPRWEDRSVELEHGEHDRKGLGEWLAGAGFDLPEAHPLARDVSPPPHPRFTPPDRTTALPPPRPPGGGAAGGAGAGLSGRAARRGARGGGRRRRAWGAPTPRLSTER